MSRFSLFDSSEDDLSSAPAVHLALFAGALASLFTAGMFAAGLNPLEPAGWKFVGLGEAVAYALWALAILTAHEAGHYRAAKRCGVETSWPYFLPGIGPIPQVGVVPFFGTFGAFMRMKMDRISARDLAAVAAEGPIAGFAVTVIAVIAGVWLSEPAAVESAEEMLILGDPLLIAGATALFHPEMGQGMELTLHPIGLAGWVGCLLTALNLLPVGQLDGGHLLYAALGERARRATPVVFAGLLVAGVWFFPGWLFLALLLGWMGIRHPSILEGQPLRRGQRWRVWICLVIFVLTFTPQPVEVAAIPELIGR